MHKDVKTTAVGHRGGWTLDSINRIFYYVTGNTKSDTACASVSSDWPNANEGGCLPTLSGIDPSTAEQFGMFSLSLKSSSSDSLDEQTRIALTVSLLRHYTADSGRKKSWVSKTRGRSMNSKSARYPRFRLFTPNPLFFPHCVFADGKKNSGSASIDASRLIFQSAVSFQIRFVAPHR